MRKFIILTITIILVIQTSAQVLEDSLKLLTPQQLGNYHLQKSKDARSGAIVLAALGAGTMLAGAFVINSSETTVFDESFSNEINSILITTGVGSALIIASIPVALSSASHKQKADALLGKTKKKNSLFLNMRSTKIPTGYAHQAIPFRGVAFGLSF